MSAITEDVSGRPVIALVIGDVGGIGPEVVLRALSDPGTYELCRPLVIGDASVLAHYMRLLDAPLHVVNVPTADAAASAHGTVDVLTPVSGGFSAIPRGEVDPAAGRFSGQCLEQAMELASAGSIEGVVWAPVNKQAFKLGGYSYRDEMEFLADWTQCPDARLFGVVGDLWVTPATLHVPFREVPRLVTQERVLGAIQAMNKVLSETGQPDPAIAVAALNPHGGDGGTLGSEEIDHIGPAVTQAQALGIRAQGPFPADTVFPRAVAEQFSGVVCMYHDQANIARKLFPFRESATVITGLPVPCATTAHGTAFDRVGAGTADPGSLLAAIRHVARIAVRADQGESAVRSACEPSRP